jgi:hypothetical protein
VAWKPDASHTATRQHGSRADGAEAKKAQEAQEAQEAQDEANEANEANEAKDKQILLAKLVFPVLLLLLTSPAVSILHRATCGEHKEALFCRQSLNKG